MRQVEAEVDRYLVLLGNAIRRQGYTQLEVQRELSWGRSYISQLMTKQKSLRVEQVLLILNVIGVDPADFFEELYASPSARHAASRITRPAVDPEQAKEQQRQLQELKGLIQGVVRLLQEKQMIDGEQLKAAVEAAEKKG